MLNQSGSYGVSSSENGSPMKPRSKSTEAFISAGSIPSAPRSNLSRSSSLRISQMQRDPAMARFGLKGRRTPPHNRSTHVINTISSTISSQSTPTHTVRRGPEEDWRPPISSQTEQLVGSFKRSATMTGIVKGQRRTEILKNSNTHELWSHPMECLKLTVRELSHIRQVFSRAEIEKYHSQTNLYKLLSKDQICLNCKIQKFNWMTWPYTCEICKAKVCKKCARKVCSPTEDPLEAAAYMIRPLDTPENTTWDPRDLKRTAKRMTACDSCVELLSHIVDNAQRALDAKTKFG